jgi:glyoxylase-like metal-dependent hydrolase (beta-lactamase superfamily II)/rhodanese-related sulfurtransferase
MLFRQLLDSSTSTLSYLLADEETGEAVLIDSVFEQHLRDLALIRELGLKLMATLETHVHADHVTGAWLMKQALGSQIGVAKAAGVNGADINLSDGDVVNVGQLRIEVRATPGHTDGCLSFVLLEQKMVFTGDALLIRGAGRTDFQQGDAHKLFRSVHDQLFSLPGDFAVYPAHDYSGRCSSTIEEEATHNPRLNRAVREQDFVGYMQNLGLPHPKNLKEAVPANLECGRPSEGCIPPSAPDWGPVIRTYAGVWQVEPEWVCQQGDQVLVVDVREPEEVRLSMLGEIAGARVMPLSSLRDRLHEVPRDRPVVLVCPAGARSAIAASILEQAGVERVASLRGGLIEWGLRGLPLLR